MSDSAGAIDSGSGAIIAFTEREMQMLAWAMQSLKSGPPEIDYEKLAGYAGMSNPRSASNAWAKIKNKLHTACPPDGSAPVATPKKTRAKKATDDGTPKTPRKRAAKEVDSEGSPKKKTRASKKKADPSDEEEVSPEPEVKAEVKTETAVKDEAEGEDEAEI